MIRLNTYSRGFTLVEMLVSLAIFTIVMTIALGALLAMSESDRKAQTLKSVINNLNFALDSMGRSIRTGQSYHCNIASGVASVPQNCTGASSIVFGAADASGTSIAYCLSNGVIKRLITAGSIPATCDSSFTAITSSEVTITNLVFAVNGAATGDGIQPKVTILISGKVLVNAAQNSLFNLQTTVTQRIYDQ